MYRSENLVILCYFTIKKGRFLAPIDRKRREEGREREREILGSYVVTPFVSN